MKLRIHQDSEARRNSAVAAATQIARLDLYPAHKRELLKVCVWKFTEANGKLHTRFRSREAGAGGRPGLQHDHVFRMSRLVDEILADPSAVPSVLERALGCVVTREEHHALTAQDRSRPELDGWARYRCLGIEVIDRQSEQALDLVVAS